MTAASNKTIIKELLPAKPDVQQERQARSTSISLWFEPPEGGWKVFFWICKPIVCAGLVAVIGSWLFQVEVLRLTVGFTLGLSALSLGFVCWLQCKRSSPVWVYVRLFLIGLGIAIVVPHVLVLFR